ERATDDVPRGRPDRDPLGGSPRWSPQVPYPVGPQRSDLSRGRIVDEEPPHHQRSRRRQDPALHPHPLGREVPAPRPPPPPRGGNRRRRCSVIEVLPRRVGHHHRPPPPHHALLGNDRIAPPAGSR